MEKEKKDRTKKKKEYNRLDFLVKNTMLFTISSFGSKLLSFFLVPLYTNILSTYEYGTIDLVSTTRNLLSYMLTICIADAVLRFVMDKTSKNTQILTFGIKIIINGSIILSVGSLICYIFNIVKWEPYCYLFLSIMFLLTGLNNLFSSFLRGIEKTTDVMVNGLLTTFSVLSCTVLALTVFRLGIIGYLSSVCIGEFIGVSYSYLRVKKYCGEIWDGSIDGAVKRKMVAYSFPLVFNGLSWWVNSSLDKYFISTMCNISQNGIYAVAGKIPGILSIFQTIFAQSWLLLAIKEYDSADSDTFFARLYTYYNVALVIGASFLIAVNIPLARVLYAKEFYVAWRSSSILSISVIFNALSGFLSGIFSAKKNNKMLASTTILAASVNTVLNIILIPRYAEVGAAIATAVSFLVMWASRLIASRKYMKMEVNYLKHILCYLLLAVQVAAQHFNEKLYFVQAIILLVIILMFAKELTAIYKIGALKIKKRVR